MTKNENRQWLLDIRPTARAFLTSEDLGKQLLKIADGRSNHEWNGF
jgi:hypothetical protein